MDMKGLRVPGHGMAGLGMPHRASSRLSDCLSI
jgi:hypothetical protein